VRYQDWLARVRAHPHALHFAIASTIVSLALMIGGLLAVRWVLVRLPPDHFVRKHEHSRTVKIVRAVAAIALMAAGVAMMVLPGPGIVAFLVGVSLLDLPIRHRIVLAILRRKHVHHALDRMRLRAGKPPFVIPEHAHSPSR
jgi:uncharacterized membrane protein YidH (DUF202 family)